MRKRGRDGNRRRTMTPRYFIADSPARLRSVAAVVVGLSASKELPLEIVVREPRREKSHDQRKLWHAMLAEIALDLGYTPGQVKQLIKSEYYGVERVRLPDGATYEIIQSSEDEDRAGYSRLIEFTMQFCAEHGVNIQERSRA